MTTTTESEHLPERERDLGFGSALMFRITRIHGAEQAPIPGPRREAAD